MPVGAVHYIFKIDLERGGGRYASGLFFALCALYRGAGVMLRDVIFKAVCHAVAYST